MYVIHDFKILNQRLSQKSYAAKQKRGSMKIPDQLKALGLPAFKGRQHSGIDVSIRLSGTFGGDRNNSANCCS